MSETNKIFWEPSREFLEGSFLFQFKEKIEKQYSKTFENYSQFHQWSVDSFQDFWREFLDFSQIKYSGDPETVFVPKEGYFYGGTWFPDIKLNFAENLLSNLNQYPIIGLDEKGQRFEYKKSQLLKEVSSLQKYFKEKGLKAGDCVAALIPNVPEAITCMLAVTSLGGIWSSCSPDFGEQGILDRFLQVEPKFLITCDKTIYNGKEFDLAVKNAAVLAKLPSVEGTLHVSRYSEEGDYKNLCQHYKASDIEFVPVPFSHPLYILFSSGTTGAPKCIVHSVGGTLIQHAKELLLHCDLKKEEKIIYYTTTGWMMWNWLVSALFTGAQVFVYDGSPMTKEGFDLWSLVENEKIDVFGTSARFIAASRTQGRLPFRKFKPRLVCSTGSPLLFEDFDYFYEVVNPEYDIQLASICGGTDIVSCFMLGCPWLPVRRGEIQGPGLAMDIQALDANGQAIFGQEGELVCATPFPSMPIYFLNDPQNKKYSAAYFEEFSGVWHHGDYVTIMPQGGIVVHGRSDATLNPGGVRLGTAEIYRQVETHPDIADSLVVGKTVDGDEKVLLFVLFKDPQQELTEELKTELKKRIREGASPRHLPSEIYKITEIPYTLSGKKVEIAVKKILHGEMPKNIQALANPHSLEAFKKFQ